MKQFFYIIALLLFSFDVFAQIDNDAIVSSGAVCNNGKREPLEPCDLSSEQADNDLCPQIGKIAGIAMVCRRELCYCLPKKYIRCDDKHTTGNEMCDASDKDYCRAVGGLVGAPLECNFKSCLCKPSGDFFLGTAGVNKTDAAANLTLSSCGNRVLEHSEECDPPGRACIYKTKDGICSDSCICEELNDEAESGAGNVSAADNSEDNVTESGAIVSNATAGFVVDEQKSDASVPQDNKTVVLQEDVSVADSLPETKVEAIADSGISDSAYTVLLIVLVIVFIIALAVGSFFIYRKSQIGNFPESKESAGEEQAVDDQGQRIRT